MMGFSFDPLWKLLIDRKMTKEQLRRELSLSPNTIAKMGRGENVSMEVLNKICTHFRCGLEEVVKYVLEDE